jgi:CheY-like chemotaxis protein
MPDQRILVVEDNAIIAMETVERLKRLGYVVPAVAAKGADAIRLCEEMEPDLVLMDINLKGGMDGIEAARTIVSAHDVPVIFLTAYSDTETLERASSVQPFRYLIKPYRERDLYAAITEALSGGLPRETPKVPETMLRFARNLDACEDAVVVTGPGGDVQFLNRKAATLSGWNAAALARRPLGTILEQDGGFLAGSGRTDFRPCILIAADGKRLPARAMIIRPATAGDGPGPAIALFFTVEGRVP